MPADGVGLHTQNLHDGGRPGHLTIDTAQWHRRVLGPGSRPTQRSGARSGSRRGRSARSSATERAKARQRGNSCERGQRQRARQPDQREEPDEDDRRQEIPARHREEDRDDQCPAVVIPAPQTTTSAASGRRHQISQMLPSGSGTHGREILGQRSGASEPRDQWRWPLSRPRRSRSVAIRVGRRTTTCRPLG